MLRLGCFCVLCFTLGFSVKIKLTVPLLYVYVCAFCLERPSLKLAILCWAERYTLHTHSLSVLCVYMSMSCLFLFAYQPCANLNFKWMDFFHIVMQAVMVVWVIFNFCLPTMSNLFDIFVYWSNVICFSTFLLTHSHIRDTFQSHFVELHLLCLLQHHPSFFTSSCDKKSSQVHLFGFFVSLLVCQSKNLLRF